MSIGSNIFKSSRWVHKYPGLILLLFMAWMSLSGVLLNHPGLLSRVSVSGFLVPGHYHPQNWNRSSMKGILTYDSLNFLAYGNQGIYISNDKGKSFTSFMDGDFPQAARKRRTNHIIRLDNSNKLMAATNKGLYIAEMDNRLWKPLKLPGNNEPVQKILFSADTCIVVTKSSVYISNKNNLANFSQQIPERQVYDEKIPLFRAFLELHDGSIWGLPGKLLWDVAGVILFFLCLSAFYMWYYPKKWKRNYRKKSIPAQKAEKNRRRFYLKYHKKLGWYFAVVFVIIFITGIFLRPPLLITIADSSIAKKIYPAWEHKNPWNQKINNALFDSKSNRLILECSDGLWAGNINSNTSFTKLDLPIPVFAMGASVFEEETPGSWLVGSFGGLYRYSLTNNISEPILKQAASRNPGRPGSLLVTGYIHLPDSTEYVLGHYKGLCDTNGNPLPNQLPMPKQLKEDFKMPLWNWLFELHNARIFQGVLGGFYILVIPLFGITGLLIILSGVFDYWYVKLKRKKNSAKGKRK